MNFITYPFLITSANAFFVPLSPFVHYIKKNVINIWIKVITLPLGLFIHFIMVMEICGIFTFTANYFIALLQQIHRILIKLRSRIIFKTFGSPMINVMKSYR